MRMLLQLGVQDLADEGVVAGGWLAGVVRDEEVVAEEDDGGQEVADTVLVVVTLHQLTHAHTLQHP